MEFGPYSAPPSLAESDVEGENSATSKPKKTKKRRPRKNAKLGFKATKSRAKKKKKLLKKNGPIAHPGSRAAAEQDAKSLSKGGSSIQELLGSGQAIGMDVDDALSLLKEMNPSFDFRVNHEYSQYPYVASVSFARLLHDNSRIVKSIVRK